MTQEQNELTDKFKLSLEFKYSPWIYLIDLTIRLVFLSFFLKHFIPTWLFIILQLSLIIIELIYNDKYIPKLKGKYYPFINKKYSKDKLEISITENIPSNLANIQLFFGFLFSYWFFYYIFTNHSWYMHFLFFFLASFSTILFFLVISLTVYYNESKGISNYKVEKLVSIKDEKGILKTEAIDVTKLFTDVLISDNRFKNISEEIKLDSIDFNDTQIAKLESELKSINSKVEAYMLESVFLGGLAFSGFLTVASANFLGKETEAFREFISHFTNFIYKCTSENFNMWYSEIQLHFFRFDLYILIMLLSLMASVFFLLVLTLRLRLNSLYLNMDHLLRILSIFNAKEEELYNWKYQNELNKNQAERLNKISKKIDIALTDANKLLKDLKPTVNLMSVYRNIALCLFYLVLIISGFYFMPFIASSIFVLAVFTQVFRLLETYSKLGKIRELIRKH